MHSYDTPQKQVEFAETADQPLLSSSSPGCIDLDELDVACGSSLLSSHWWNQVSKEGRPTVVAWFLSVTALVLLVNVAVLSAHYCSLPFCVPSFTSQAAADYSDGGNSELPPPPSTTADLDAIRTLVAFVRSTPPRSADRGNVTNMTLLAPTADYITGMTLNHQLFGSSRTSDPRQYTEPLMFHTYWVGPLLAKHVLSVQSCWLHHMSNERVVPLRRIVIWTDEAGLRDTEPVLLAQFAALKGVELRVLNISAEAKDSALEGSYVLNATTSIGLAWYSDVVRYALLYRYGGVWFDLDVLWLRSIDPLLLTFDTQILVYTWENQRYPNGAVFVSLQSRSPQLERATQFILARHMGFGFQEAQLTFDLPLDFLVLPCAWFDADWQDNVLAPQFSFDRFGNSRPASLQRCTLDNFHAGAFTYHWHNQWTHPINMTHSCLGDLQTDLLASLRRLGAT